MSATHDCGIIIVLLYSEMLLLGNQRRFYPLFKYRYQIRIKCY